MAPTGCAWPGVRRLLDQEVLGEDDGAPPFVARLGWRELTRARRGWQQGRPA